MSETLEKLVHRGTRVAFSAPMFAKAYFGTVWARSGARITIDLEDPQEGPAFGVGCALEAHFLLPTRVLSFSTRILADNGREVTISAPRSMLAQRQSPLRRLARLAFPARFRVLVEPDPSGSDWPVRRRAPEAANPVIEAVCRDIGPGGIGIASNTVPEPGSRVEFWLSPGRNEEEIHGEGTVKGRRSWPGASGFGISLAAVSRVSKARLQKLLEQPNEPEVEPDIENPPHAADRAA